MGGKMGVGKRGVGMKVGKRGEGMRVGKGLRAGKGYLRVGK